MKRVEIAAALSLLFGAGSLQAQLLWSDTLSSNRSPAAIIDTIDRRQEAPKPPAKVKIIKRQSNYREQVGLALGMMAFIAFIMTATQTWNPD
jgi:hypothetical protein